MIVTSRSPLVYLYRCTAELQNNTASVYAIRTIPVQRSNGTCHSAAGLWNFGTKTLIWSNSPSFRWKTKSTEENLTYIYADFERKIAPNPPMYVRQIEILSKRNSTVRPCNNKWAFTWDVYLAGSVVWFSSNLVPLSYALAGLLNNNVNEKGLFVLVSDRLEFLFSFFEFIRVLT